MMSHLNVAQVSKAITLFENGLTFNEVAKTLRIPDIKDDVAKVLLLRRMTELLSAVYSETALAFLPRYVASCRKFEE